MRLQFIPIHVFRETPSVTFFDAGVSGTNGTDVVVHRGAATSPPDANGFEQYYLQGQRTFVLLNPAWDQSHHVIHLIRKMGALQIPVGTYHRSTSGETGSMVLNQSLHDPQFDFKTEFIPWVWSWKDGHICRSH